MRVVISNFSEPVDKTMDFGSYWSTATLPKRSERFRLFENRADWGFHIYSMGVYLMDLGIADEVEFWDYSGERSAAYHSYGILRIKFYNQHDVMAYLDRFGYPDLYINHGGNGLPILQHVNGKCFRVHVPALRAGTEAEDRSVAECFLMDAEEDLDSQSMQYIPVVNTAKIFPVSCAKKRDFIYLASFYPGKRHDILLKAVRGTGLSGHFHPVDSRVMDLQNTHVTTTNFNESEVVELLRTSRIAVYPGDNTSNPAAMWECVAANLPIVVNENIKGGKHLVVPGVTGEFAGEDDFYDVMMYVLQKRKYYTPWEYFKENWGTISLLERYLSFFRKMGWGY